MEINKLTGTNKRLDPPQLSENERTAVQHMAHFMRPDHVELFGREYWADLDGRVFVVAWESDGKVSGDPI